LLENFHVASLKSLLLSAIRNRKIFLLKRMFGKLKTLFFLGTQIDILRLRQVGKAMNLWQFKSFGGMRGSQNANELDDRNIIRFKHISMHKRRRKLLITNQIT
jgi:hypothetical protein